MKKKIDRQIALMEASIELQQFLTDLLEDRLRDQLRQELKAALEHEFREECVNIAVVLTAPPLEHIGDAAAWWCQIATAARVQSGRLSEQKVIPATALREYFRRFLGDKTVRRSGL